jgi:predicted neuraminidase
MESQRDLIMTSSSLLPDEATTMPGKLHRAAGDDIRIDAYLPAATTQNHAANLIALKNGDLLCAWFGGTQEGVPDISVYLSRLDAGSTVWSDPVRLSDDPTRSEQNPILFETPEGKLWLIYTAQLSGTRTRPSSVAASRRTTGAVGGRSRRCSMRRARSSGNRSSSHRTARGCARSSCAASLRASGGPAMTTSAP